MTLHLAAVHAASALPLVCCLFRWRTVRSGDTEASILGRRLALWSIGLLTFGVAIGTLILALLWLAERRDLFTAARYLPPYKLEYAAIELVFSVACMAAYYKTWNAAAVGGPWRRMAHHLLAIAAATNLIYHFPPLFLALKRLAGASGPLVQPQFRALIFEPRILSMWLHHVLAGFAAAGVWTMFVARRQNPSSVARGARIALVATLAQIPIGLWALVALPENDALLGGDAITTGLLAAGIAVALALLHHLAAAAMGPAAMIGAEKSTPVRCLALLLTVMLLMNAANYRVRPPASSLQPPASH
jgi:hypothetical protein